MTSELNTIDKIAKDVFENVDERTLLELFVNKDNTPLAFAFKDAFSRWLRNHYRLWIDNPLTKGWRTSEESRDIRNGVDYSEDHPDQVSEKIFQRMKELYENGYCRQSAI